MTFLVIDTSVLIAVIANEPEKPALITMTTGVDLLTPASVPWEIGNAFSAMLKRKRITIAQTQQALKAYQQTAVRYMDVGLADALQLADRLAIYAYDAYVIQCAVSARCPLLTLDQGLIDAARRAGVKVLEVML